MTDTGYPTRLKEILETEGRTQSWLARQLGCTRSMVCEWASGDHMPLEATCEQIARTLGRTVDDVFPNTAERNAA